MRRISRLLVANRSEIAIRVFRTGHELGIRTVAHLCARRPLRPAPLQGGRGLSHRPARRADPLVPRHRRIIALAKAAAVDAIHPGYGFLSENPDLARACQRRASSSSGRGRSSWSSLGDKIAARAIAQQRRHSDPFRQPAARARMPAKDSARRRKWAFPSSSRRPKGAAAAGCGSSARPADFAGAFEQAQRESAGGFRLVGRFSGKVHPAGPPYRGSTSRRPARQPRPSL